LLNNSADNQYSLVEDKDDEKIVQKEVVVTTIGLVVHSVADGVALASS